MKKIYMILCLGLLAVSATSCLEDAMPTSSVTGEQLQNGGLNPETQLNGIIAKMTRFGGDYTACGYAGQMIQRETMTDVMPVFDSGYDYYRWFGFTTSLGGGNYTYLGDIWNQYYQLILNANSMIGAADEKTASKSDLHYVGNALVYRAMYYFDLVRMYEYKHTGIPSMDAAAEKILKLTVPLVTEFTTEEQSRNNPRAPFYQMYRFIMNDLNRAEAYLEGFTRKTKNYVDQTVVWGLKARLYQELASRFEKYPEDLDTQLAHETDAALTSYATLNITSAADCWQQAQAYALKVINSGNYSALTEGQWYDTQTGFNKANQAWMWAICIDSEDNAVHTWEAFTPNMSTECSTGTADVSCQAYRMINKALYEQISAGDWRKQTWIDPADAGKTSSYANYKTLLSPTEWAKRPAYTGFKFRPGQGNMDDYTVSTAVDIPLMRVEEMSYIIAEAKSHLQSPSMGVRYLNNFLNTYRGTGFALTANTQEEFDQMLIAQKAIEFWGEGIMMWDYKRMEMPVVRKYDGTNWIEAYRYTSLPNYVARWMNLFMPASEYQYNTAIVNNPNASWDSSYAY